MGEDRGRRVSGCAAAKTGAHFREDRHVGLPPLMLHVLDLVVCLRHVALDAQLPRRGELAQAPQEVVRARWDEAGGEDRLDQAYIVDDPVGQLLTLATEILRRLQSYLC